MSPDIIIVGGGIGGLTLALALQGHGHTRIRILEAAPEWKPLGVGINLMPHAVRELSGLGLQDALARVALQPADYAFFTRNGQLVYREKWGLAAGYKWPHFSIHRADLHQVLRDAVVARLGGDVLRLGRPCFAVEQDDAGVTVHLTDAAGRAVASERGDVVIGCDGIHSRVRAGMYPDEGPPVFHGINLWRGVTRRGPFLTGASIARIGATDTTLIVYPIRANIDGAGNQLVNWVAEVKTDTRAPMDWSAPGRLEDFYPLYQDWNFDWLDAAALIREADFIFSYPMVDRDPVARWSFGRVTLLGDAAHPMYPRGGNGGAQAIIDATTLARSLTDAADPVAALREYEDARLSPTSRVVEQNRTAPPNLIVDTVEKRTGGKRFERLEDVVSPGELRQIFDTYRRIAGYHIDLVGRADEPVRPASSAAPARP